MNISALSIPIYSGSGGTGLEIAMMSKALDTAEITGTLIFVHNMSAKTKRGG